MDRQLQTFTNCSLCDRLRQTDTKMKQASREYPKIGYLRRAVMPLETRGFIL